VFTLVVMAAGVGSRYGGVKQLAPVGPDGEAFLDFAIAGAVEAGADKVVIVVRTEIADDVRGHVEARHGALASAGVDVAYVHQDRHGPQRAKPWGTGHAALSAAPEVDGPFVICNADDYYGAAAFTALADPLPELGSDEAALCGYRLGYTLPAQGTVSRGVCAVDGGRLVGIVEHHGVARRADGVIVSTDPEAVLGESAVVSMNLWAFQPVMLDWIDEGFGRFLDTCGDDPDAEYIPPEIVATKMAEGALTVHAVTTDHHWTGITNPQDLFSARAVLSRRDAGHEVTGGRMPTGGFSARRAVLSRRDAAMSSERPASVTPRRLFALEV